MMAPSPYGPFLDVLPEPMLLVDREGVVVSANPAATGLFACQQSAVVGRTLRHLTLNTDEELDRLLTSWRSGRELHPGGLTFCLGGRSPVECKVEGGLAAAANNGAAAYIVLRLSGSEPPPARRSPGPGEWLRAVLAGAGDAILATNAAGQIEFMNPIAQELTGWKESEAVGQPLQIVFPVQDEAAPPASRAVMTSRNGSHRLIARRTTLLHDAHGAVSGALVIFRDLADQHRASGEQQRLLEELRQANEGLKQFADSASHDLQEPLRMVAIYSQLLRRKLAPEMDEETTQYLNYTVQGARRIEALVRDLLAYTEAGIVNDAEPLEPVNCKAALDTALANLRLPIEESGAQINAGPLPVIAARQTDFVQLFQNLVANAVKYRGSRPPLISVSAVRRAAEWEFSVCDNGLGIPVQYYDHIFGVFKRLHARSSSSAGTGIGLAICKKIVERYHGRVWVESEEGRGSTFYFTIPDSVPPGSALSSQ